MSTTTTLVQETAIDIDARTSDVKKELVVADMASVSSSTPLGTSASSFVPVKSLHINSKGVAVLRLPLPYRELKTAVYNFDGSIAYTSTRARLNSGNCVLTNAKGKELIKTTYWFGLRKDPIIHRLNAAHDVELSTKPSTTDTGDDIKTISRWTSRSHTFLLPDGRKFSWSYKRDKGFGKDGSKGTALVLRSGDKRFAALIRNDETRTPGSMSCSAGNGGELVLSQYVNSQDGIDEELVVATCLLMLKKEIDRRRTVQFMVIGAAVSA